jgi:hypothetical protein
MYTLKIRPEAKMSRTIPNFDAQNPQTVHDILWAWSQRHISTKDAMEKIWAEDKLELYQAAFDNDVPFPGKADEDDIRMATEFLAATQGPRP